MGTAVSRRGVFVRWDGVGVGLGGTVVGWGDGDWLVGFWRGVLSREWMRWG